MEIHIKTTSSAKHGKFPTLKNLFTQSSEKTSNSLRLSVTGKHIFYAGTGKAGEIHDLLIKKPRFHVAPLGRRAGFGGLTTIKEFAESQTDITNTSQTIHGSRNGNGKLRNAGNCTREELGFMERRIRGIPQASLFGNSLLTT